MDHKFFQTLISFLNILDWKFSEPKFFGPTFLLPLLRTNSFFDLNFFEQKFFWTNFFVEPNAFLYNTFLTNIYVPKFYLYGNFRPIFSMIKIKFFQKFFLSNFFGKTFFIANFCWPNLIYGHSFGSDLRFILPKSFFVKISYG